MRRFLLCVLLLGAASAVRAASAPAYVRFPAIHGDTIVFTAEGDLWKVGLAGGLAQRLTTHAGEEGHAAISPDGRTVAFSATYEGPTEVYTMPIDGGLPVRQTFFGDRAYPVGWTPKGRILVATSHDATLPDLQLLEIDPASHVIDRLPLAEAAEGAFDSSGRTLFFTRLAAQPSHTKRYKGGTAQNIWRFSGSGEAVPLTPDYVGTSKAPMWWRGRVYFASDRDGTMNLWSMDENGKSLKQLTHNVGWDLQSPTLSEGRIAYQLGADLHVVDVSSGLDRTVTVRLASDFDQLREKWIDNPMDYLTAAHLSPKGDRIVLTARGQVFVAPVKQGRLVEATRSAGVRYRQAHFMPDGASLVTLSDESGEVEWWRLSANGVGKPEQLTRDGTVLRFDGMPSPDGKWIAYYDKNQELWVVDLVAHRTVKVASSSEGDFSDLAWSPDSAWLAFVMPAANTFQQIRLYRVADATTVALTDDRTDSYAPAWSPDGKWIYFLSDRHLTSLVSGPWGPRQPEPFIDRPTEIFAVALTAGERFPFRPSDELQAQDTENKVAAKDGGKTDKSKQEEAKKEEKPGVHVKIDLEGLDSRLYQVPVPAGDYESLAANGERLFWISHSLDRERKASLLALDITNREQKPKTLLGDVRSFELSADGKKVLARSGQSLLVFEAPAGDKVDPSEKSVDLSGWRFSIDPSEEWRQMFTEAWRLERDYFWDGHMSGLDWPEIKAKYQPLVARVTDRAELSDLLGQMISELSALHMFVYGGDMRKGKDDISPASLGAVLTRDDAAGGYRVAHIYRTDPDYPDSMAPLARPGVDVHEGDVIEAINGVATLSVDDPATLLRDQAGRQVLLHVKGHDGASRDAIVEPISPEKAADLRYSEWEYTRRQRVEELGKGEIGYLHLRAMGGGNYTEWARNFYPVFKRSGLIVDVRHNRGGNIDSWILEKLMRRAWFYWQPRVGSPDWNMQFAFRGHIVVLVDQFTASDGEAFAEGFRRLGLGKVIGMRTWGGEIWLSSSNILVDKGIATAAEIGVYGPEGEWLIEGHGVEPDIVVDNLPHATFQGSDAQLDAAVRFLQKEIKEDPNPVPPAPAYPDKAVPAPAH
jgi:tricorn protease